MNTWIDGSYRTAAAAVEHIDPRALQTPFCVLIVVVNVDRRLGQQVTAFSLTVVRCGLVTS